MLELRHEYIDRRKYAVEAERRVLRAQSRRHAEQLLWMLRHHDDEEISDAETWFRDGVDYVLAFYSVCEIGAATGHLPAALPQQLLEKALVFLDHPAVRTYYEYRYPLKLPVLYRDRILAGQILLHPGVADPRDSFSVFLELSRPIENDIDLESFLWFLDGGTRWDDHRDDYVDIDDTRSVLRKPKQMVRVLSTKPSKRGELDRSVVGFGKFLQFCGDFERLLIEVGDSPRLQAYYWHYHAYWFRHAAERLRRELPEAIAALSKWRSARTGKTARDYERERKALNNTIRRLTSSKYGKALDHPNGKRLASH